MRQQLGSLGASLGLVGGGPAVGRRSTQQQLVSGEPDDERATADREQLDWRLPDGRLREQQHCSMRNNGKLQLAAIVHYDSLEQLGGGGDRVGQFDSVPNHDNARKGATDLKLARQQQASSSSPLGAYNSHVGGGSDANGLDESDEHCRQSTKKPAGRLSRLFFTKNNAKKKEKIAHRQKGSGDLIDNSPTTRQADVEQAQLEHIQQPKQQPADYASPPTDLSSDASGHQTTTATGQRQTIEFKFDLIVEGDRETTTTTTLPGACGPTPSRDPVHQEAGNNDEILRPIRQRKLLDNVNELIESFVLDSVDVCLLTAGRRRLQLAAGKLATATASSDYLCGRDQFDYVLKCAELSLTYAFQLLEATKSAPVGSGSGVPASATAACSPLRADGHSIELEAILFEQHSDGSPMGLLDLLAATARNDDQSVASTEPSSSGQVSSRECSRVGEALEALEAIRSRVESRCERAANDELREDNESSASSRSSPSLLSSSSKPTNLILMVNLKLKQQVNGGNFTNRMCLLDISEPKSSELVTIVESIFSGKALAHLKRQKLYLQALEKVQMSSQTTTNETSLINDNNNNNNKHHHQVAYLTRLIRAEWLIYKQLSSALIKTLAIVHCHKLAPASSSTTPPSAAPVISSAANQRTLAERRLMDYNLGLLEFIRRLQKASVLRMKRRKRHLRSHLAKSNLSLVSDTNLSMDSYSDQHPVQDLMISSPHRQRVFHQPTAAQQAAGCGGGGPSFKQASCCKEHWPGAMMNSSAGSNSLRLLHHYNSYTGHYYQQRHNSATSKRSGQQHRAQQLYQHRSRHTSRHYRHHNYNHYPHHHHHHHHHGHSHYGRPSRAASLNWRHSATNDLEATESSSPISTPSSAGNRNHYHSRQLMSALDNCLGAVKSTTTTAAHVQLPSGSGRIHRADSETLGHTIGTTTDGLVLTPKRSLVVESDPDDSMASLASASLVSCQSAASRRNTTALSSSLNDPRTRRRLQQLQLDSPSDSNTIDDSIEMQSLSSSIVQHQNQRSQTKRPSSPDRLAMVDQWRDEETGGVNNADNASDTCSMVVAEPPRQLKLEEFLNRLSNFIGPQLGTTNGQQLSEACESVSRRKSTDDDEGVNDDNEADEEDQDQDDDDEDCKSHSSILEHLSSLTMESNLKLVKQQQHHRHLGTDRVSIVSTDGQCDRWPNGNGGGHLQRLLKSTLKLQQKQQPNQTDLAQQLRELTIDCSDNGKHKLGPQQGGSHCQRSGLCNGGDAVSNETPPTSMESSCVSSSSSSSSSSCSRLPAGATIASSSNNNQRVLDHLYASVARHHQKAAQIKLP